jgi:hypothetical protein
VGYVSVGLLLCTSLLSEIHNALVPAFLSFQQGRPCSPRLLETVAARVASSSIPRAMASVELLLIELAGGTCVVSLLHDLGFVAGFSCILR